MHKEVLGHLAKTLKSRQEKEPALGELVDTATVDPLHAMNNAWEHVFACFVTRCLQLSRLQRREDIELNPQTPLAKFLRLLKRTFHLHRLHRKLYDWLKEAGMKDGTGSKLHIRLNGMEARMFCHHVMDMVDCLLPAVEGRPIQMVHVHGLAYVALQLRDAVLIFSRYTVTNEQVKQLRTHCRRFFNACTLFVDCPVTPTMWLIGHVVPEHTKKMKEEIGFGLDGDHTRERRKGAGSQEVPGAHNRCQQV